MLDLAGADTKSQGTKGTVGRSVAVTADDSGTWEGEALLRTNDVDDALALVAEAEVCETEVLDILLECDTLCS